MCIDQVFSIESVADDEADAVPNFATRTEAWRATGPETEKAEAEEADAQVTCSHVAVTAHVMEPTEMIALAVFIMAFRTGFLTNHYVG